MRSTARRFFGSAAAAILAACGGSPSIGVAPSLAPSAIRSRGPVRATPILFGFTTLDQPYTKFNRLLGINNTGRIVGYSGSGSRHDPSVGYLVSPPYISKNYLPLQFPGATNTIATSLNNRHEVTGYFVDGHNGGTLGFAYVDQIWTAYQNPHAQGSLGVTRLLGLNESGVAVGAYQSPSSDGAFSMPIGTGNFKAIKVSGGTNVVATGIDAHGDIIGYLTVRSGATVGFLIKESTHRVYEFTYPDATSTQFLGITIGDRIVGSYVDAQGMTHGFLLLHPFNNTISWQELDDPLGIGTTVATSINLHYDIVGWYVDKRGATHGFIASPLTYK